MEKALAMPSSAALKALPEAALLGLACESAASGNVEQMKVLIQAGVQVNMGTAYDKRTPLHLAAAAGQLDMVKYLVGNGAQLQRDRFGLLPIHDAVENGHAEVRRLLQSRKLQDEGSLTRRRRSDSFETEAALIPIGSTFRGQQLDEIMATVFEIAAKEGVFSYSTVHTEVQHFFKGLNLHPAYFEHFTAFQIAKHVHCLIAAKRVVQATDDMRRMYFVFHGENLAFFLSTILREAGGQTAAQKRTEEKVNKHIQTLENDSGFFEFSMIYMASDGPTFLGGAEQLGIWATEKSIFHARKETLKEKETCLELLASQKFLKEKSREAKEQYQIMMEDVVTSGRAVTRIVPGSAYPGPYPGGFVLMFGTIETAGRHYFPEVCQAMRFAGLAPKRLYVESFLNGVLTYSLFFPSAKESEIRKLERAVLYSTMLKPHGRSAIIYQNVMESKIAHDVGLYLLAAVKFVYAFFPKEQYAREYTTVHQVLDKDPSSQRKLESLYRLCMKELLSLERIYELVSRNLQLSITLFEHFRKIAHGQGCQVANQELARAIDEACSDQQDRQILRMFLTFNESILLTNFFKAETPGAFAFCLNPAVCLKDRPASLYPELPYRIYLIHGRDFSGFHVRFRDVARGGIRMIMSRDQSTFERNYATLFDECYNLAYTQQNKNKDIPEGGAKGVVLPHISQKSINNPAFGKSCFTQYFNALLDCMMPEQSGIQCHQMQGRKELLYFGPDENTAGFMDHGANLARERGYPYWKAVTTGKSSKLGGVPHDTYGMTTCSVHTYVTELLRVLGEDEEKITKFQTGGPDGDLGSNEILVSKDKTIGIVDGSGVIYDPAGINRGELTRLATRRLPIKHFNRSFLGDGAFLVTVEESDVELPDGSKWRNGVELRDTFHMSSYASADLFVPCGGRPNSVTTDNVKKLFTADGRPKFRMVVEGANLFMSDGARTALEKAGVHVFRDASTNKGGVNSSSLEVFAALALPDADHGSLMTYDSAGDSEPPEFYSKYVQEILDVISENAKKEFAAIWKANQQDGILKIEATQRLSAQINSMTDSIHSQFEQMSESERGLLVHSVLSRAVPPIMVERLGVEGIIKHVPQNYVRSLVAAWIASRYVYQHGIGASEVSFFFFMNSLLNGKSTVETGTNGVKRFAPTDDSPVPASRPRLSDN